MSKKQILYKALMEIALHCKERWKKMIYCEGCDLESFCNDEDINFDYIVALSFLKDNKHYPKQPSPYSEP